MNKAVTVLHCDRFFIIAVSYPRSAPTLPKPHYPLPRTKLASLVKWRWIDGKAQTVALLRFYLRHTHLFYSPNFSAVKTEGLLPVSTIILIGVI